MQHGIPHALQRIAVLFAFLHAAGLHSVSAAPLETSILTVRDELLPYAASEGSTAPPARVTLETPAELMAENGAIRFDSGMAGLAFDDVKAFILRSESRRWIGSEASRIETYHLGPVGAAAPPLPGWARNFGRHAAWSPASVAAVGPGTPYVNRAQAVWNVSDPALSDARGEMLFRAQLDLPDTAALVQARLHLGVTAEIIDVRLNDHPLLLGPDARGLLSPHEVTELLHSGSNVLGFHLRVPGASAITHPSLAFSLEYTVIEKPVADDPGAFRAPGYDQALLHSRNGDRVRGRLLTFNPVSVLLQTPYGRYGVDWDQTESIVFPRGWFAPPPERPPLQRRVARLFNRSGGNDLEVVQGLRPIGAPIGAPAAFETGGVLLTDRRFFRDELLSFENDELRLRRHDSGETLNLARNEIAAIYPPGPDSFRIERPSAAFAQLRCRLRTIHGEIFSGILRQANARRIVLEHAGDGILSFNPAEVVWIWFPRHRDRTQAAFVPLMETAAGSASLRGRRIAIISMPSADIPPSDSEQRLHAEVQQAAFLAGWECAYPDPEALLDREKLNSRTHPIAVMASPRGRYTHTLHAEGDLATGLAEYVHTGGTLLLYVSGDTPGAHASPDGPQAAATPALWVLARELHLTALAPGEEGSRPERSFSHPPNFSTALFMNRSSSVPRGLGSLPMTIDAPDLSVASYLPILEADGRHEAIYQLMSEGGRVFGPALLVTRLGAGRVIVIHHLLWMSRVEGRPFSEVGLPQILAWAAGPPSN